jgi:Ca-activated chloride channel family protein
MMWIKDLEFERTYILWFLLLLPLLAWWLEHIKHRKKLFINIPALTDGLQKKSKSLGFYEVLYKSLVYLRILALAFIVVALARPVSYSYQEKVSIEGIDIMLVNDISGSMLAEDLKPNRLESAKNVAIQFIEGRKNDRIGMIAFSGSAFTLCPLTTDHRMLIHLIKQLRNGMVEDGTAIGDGLALAVDRLRNSEAVSKVIILLTDGINNRGYISPLFASELAKQRGIRVYTIGVGTNKGKAPYPVIDVMGRKTYDFIDVEIDEEMLSQIAKNTGGKYFRATDNTSLEKIYQDIDKMEKTLFQVAHLSQRAELYHFPLMIAMLLLFLEFFIKYIIIKPLP